MSVDVYFDEIKKLFYWFEIKYNDYVKLKRRPTMNCQEKINDKKKHRKNT